jgi:hypothetical protein
VFRDFLRHLDSFQRKAPVYPSRSFSAARRKPAKRTRRG